MKLHKIFLLCAVALATILSSCSSDDDSVVTEDYVTYATAAAYDYFWGWDATGESVVPTDVNIEYSASLDLYRVKDLLLAGNILYFKYDKTTGKVTVTDSEGKAITKWYSGVADAGYGYPVYGLTNSEDCAFYYDKDENKFVFGFDYWEIDDNYDYGVYPLYLMNVKLAN